MWIEASCNPNQISGRCPSDTSSGARIDDYDVSDYNLPEDEESENFVKFTAQERHWEIDSNHDSYQIIFGENEKFLQDDPIRGNQGRGKQNQFSVQNPMLNGRPMALYNMNADALESDAELVVPDVQEIEDVCFKESSKNNLKMILIMIKSDLETAHTLAWTISFDQISYYAE